MEVGWTSPGNPNSRATSERQWAIWCLLCRCINFPLRSLLFWGALMRTLRIEDVRVKWFLTFCLFVRKRENRRKPKRRSRISRMHNTLRVVGNRLKLKGRLCPLPGVSWFDLYWKSTSVPALEVLLGSDSGVVKIWWRDTQGSSAGLSRFNRFKKRQEVPCFRQSPARTRPSFVNSWLCVNEGLPQSLSASEEAARGGSCPHPN